MRKLSVHELNRPSVEEFKAAPKISITIILDNVRSLNNIGSVFRTADAFVVEKVILCGISTPPPHPEIHKTALGAELSVRWDYYSSALEAIEKLQIEGWSIVGVEQVENSTMLNQFTAERNKKYALVFGNEVKGVQQAVIDRCDCCVEIPQEGTKHSLNIAVSAGIVMWHFYRQLI